MLGSGSPSRYGLVEVVELVDEVVDVDKEVVEEVDSELLEDDVDSLEV
jgi:hypothetical protein